MAFAYGRLGLTPVELAGLTPFQFELMCKGYSDAIDKEESNFRKLGWIVFAMQADPKALKKTTIDEIWPTQKTVNKAKERTGITKRKVNSIMDKFKKLKNIE